MPKRSFFQKLTGSYPYDDEPAHEHGPEEKVPPHKKNHARPPAAHHHAVAPASPDDEGELTVDVYQTPDAIIVQSMVAGVKPDDLEIAITREMVTIRGSRHDVREVEENDYFYKELYWGTFSRTVLLPQEVEPEEAEASERHGLLTIHLPKINREKIQKLKVRSGN